MSAKKFNTIYDAHERVFTASGSPVKDTYTLVEDKETGVESLKVTGKVNIYQDIQSHADSVDIHVLLDRFARGDYEALGKHPTGYYMDITNMPDNLQEAHALITDAQQIFDHLPVKVKQEFNNSFTEWLAQVGSAKWMQAHDLVSESVQVEEIKESVKESVGESDE